MHEGSSPNSVRATSKSIVLPSPSHGTGQTFGYFGLLTLFIYLATPAGLLVDIQTSYMLKNQLHAGATAIANFRLLTAVPVYLAFVAGLVRDQWNPLGLRDRGYFLMFGPAAAVVFVVLALSPLSYAGLLAGMLLVMILSRFSFAAYQGLMALVGQERLMSGRLSVVWQVVASCPVILGAFASGYVSDHLKPTSTFVLVALFSVCIGLLGLLKPRAVFSHAYDKPPAAKADFGGSVRRLVRHRAIYPVMFIWLLWNFAPGGNTPLQFYLTNELHASDAAYSYFNGIFALTSVPAFLLYGFLCKRVPIRKLMWWGAIIAVPQWVPLAFVHDARQALWLAAPIGFLGGVATAAYYDLAMRSCPPGLQGTMMMLVEAVLVLSARGGDVLGTRIYYSSPAHGFLNCVVATTAAYAAILPLLLLVPREVSATADGQANPVIDAQALHGFPMVPRDDSV